MEKFKEIVANLKGDLAIFATAVDPDAIASALALRHIIEHLNSHQEKQFKITIFYGGIVGHPQTRAMFSTYSLHEHVHPSENFDRSKFSHIALVDSSKLIDSRCPAINNIEPLIVIDHHSESSIPESQNTFIWIESVNATATLITELARELKLSLPSYILTLLALGIYSDTKGMEKAEPREYKALAWLMEKEGVSISFGKLIAYTLPQSYYAQEKLAYKNYIREKSWLLTNIEFISSSNGDNIATIADKFTRQEGVSLVIVFGIIDNSYVRISVRSNDVAVPISEILKRFGKSTGFKTTSNGKGEGGARINLKNLKPWFIENTREEILALVNRYITYLVFQSKKAP